MNNPDKRKGYRRNRKMRQRQVDGQYSEKDFENKRFNLQGNRCYWSHAPLAQDRSKVAADHIMPVSKGGGNYLDNIVATHPDVNQQKQDLMVWDWLGITFGQWMLALHGSPNAKLSPVLWTGPVERSQQEVDKLRIRYSSYPLRWLPLKVE